MLQKNRVMKPPESRSPVARLRELTPGIALCLAVTLVSIGLQHLEEGAFEHPYIEALVIAILLGTIVRSRWTPGARWRPGIDFSAKPLLEVAVVLLGASISAAMVVAAGFLLPLAILAVVAITIVISTALGRLLGLPPRMALLVACGNSICGNSAIVAVAPVIGADGEDVAASIAFTAVLGVLVVLGLPLIGYLLDLEGLRYGVLAGLTVYAVPQVLAAAAPMGASAVQMATLVKLVRVLMLGPVCLAFALIAPRIPPQAEPADEVVAGEAPRPGGRPSFGQLVPWFIIGFVLLVVARSLGLLPEAVLPFVGTLATLLTVVAMAALGLGVDVRTVVAAGGRVTATVVLSLLALGAISLLLLHWLPLSQG